MDTDALPEISLADAVTPDAPPAAAFPIVAIGASAGGLTALSRLLEGIPADCGMGFVIVTHLDPRSESRLPELLAKHTPLPVVHAQEGQAVQPNHVYVIPPNVTLTVQDAILHAAPLTERSAKVKAIDVFMRHLARDQKAAGVGIVLTGIDADGTMGVKQIKAEGGMVIVQDPLTAEYDSMPRNALATGLADLVLPVEDIGAALVAYVRDAGLGKPLGHPATSDEAQEITGILVALHAAGAPDFREYKPGMIARRIKHHMAIAGIPTIAEFRKHIETSADARNALAEDFLIGVTEFFREPGCWEALSETLTELFQRNGDKPVRVWVPGCASGEEAYTLAMLLSELAPSPDARARVEIFATDINRKALDHARAGVYPASVVHAISPERLRRFFTQTGDSFQVRKELRSMILFSVQNLLQDPPFSRLDLVSCRNLLIYLRPGIQRHLASLFAFSLNDDGYLVLGRSESLAREQDLFEEIHPKARIFKRKPGVRPHIVSFNLNASFAEQTELRRPAHALRHQETVQLVHKALLARFTPAAVLVNRGFQVLYFHGNVDAFLRRTSGSPTDSLLEMAREGLSFPVRSAFHQALDKNRTVSVEADMVEQDQAAAVRITVAPLPEPHGREPLYLATFEKIERRDVADHARAQQPIGGSEFEQELRQTRQDMQEVIQDLQHANEELKVSNEEGLSANEELQSANEELASSKEEMQSLNEELTTVNAQLEVKVRELELINNDLDNFLQKTGVICLFLDRALRIKRYTAAVTDLYAVVPSDIGRAITDFASPFMESGLIDTARRVMTDLNSVETELRTHDGRWYWSLLQPYQSEDNFVAGVVMTFTEITSLKKAEEGMRQLATVMEDSNDAVTVQDFEGHILKWNRGAERLYGYSAAEARAMNILAVIPDAARARYQSVIASMRLGETIPSLETQRTTKDGRTLDVWLTASVLHDENGLAHAVATTERDITARLRTEQQLRYNAMRLQEADRRRTEFLAMLAHELRNPLAPVRQALHIMRQSASSPEQLTWATDLMDRQTRQLARLIDDLLDVARITSGKVRLQREALDMRVVVRNALDSTNPLLQGRAHRLSVELPEEAVWVFGDAARLQQIIANLLTNAYKYTPPGGGVAVSLTRRHNTAELRIVDTGMGIAEDLLSQVFEMFVQGDQAMDRSQGGLGIGLTLVRQLVEMHSGQVEARSDGAGKGSEFLVRLPTIPAERESGSERPQPKSKDRPVQHRILIVDDNVDFAESTRMLLEFEQHEVRVVHDGMSALEAAKAFSPQVVLLDLGLPGMNGYETARHLRAMPNMRDALLIAISGYAQEEDRQRSRREGFNKHLQKPVEFQEILDAIEGN